MKEIIHKLMYSWPVIILMMVVFYPVGLYLLYKRYSLERNNVAICKAGIVLLVISIVLILFSKYLSIYFVFMTLYFLCAGFAFIMLASEKQRHKIRYKKYLNIIGNGDIDRIDEIADIAGVKYKTAIKDLNKMVKTEYLPDDTYVNEIEGRLILPEWYLSMKQEEALKIDNYVDDCIDEFEEEIATKVVLCKGCGANNKVVVGKACACEYCGSAIEC